MFCEEIAPINEMSGSCQSTNSNTEKDKLGFGVTEAQGIFNINN